jgi:phosphoglycerate kinase
MLKNVKNRDSFAGKLGDMKKLSECSFDGKRVLVRVDFNVPLDENGVILDDSRIVGALPTLKTILKSNGKVIIMSHLGRPKGQSQDKYSLKQIVNHLSKTLETTVLFANDCIGSEAEEKVNALKGGEVLLLENLRFHKEETEGDKDFSEKLASLGDFYVNDAFGTAHREHASTAVIANYFKGNCCFGLLMESEILNVKKVLNSKEKPVTAVVGGAKVSSKIDILFNLLSKVDNLIIGGGMAYTFASAQGGRVGKSLVESDKLGLAKEILESATQKGVKVYLPVDSINASEFSNDTERIASDIMNIADNQMGLDIGLKSLEVFKEVLLASKVILWNGPMGVFEFENFSNGTKGVGQSIVESTANGCFSLVGGGDSVSAAKQFNLAEGMSYISTGGGAMLEYLEGKTLPGIQAILDANS